MRGGAAWLVRAAAMAMLGASVAMSPQREEPAGYVDPHGRSGAHSTNSGIRSTVRNPDASAGTHSGDGNARAVARRFFQRVASVTREPCGLLDAAAKCTAKQDMILVLDSSASAAAFRSWALAFIDRFAFDAADADSPRLAIVNHDGDSAASGVLSPLSADSAVLKASVSGLRVSTRASSITHSLQAAWELMRGAASRGAKPVLLLLISGGQAANATAWRKAAEIKAEGADIFAAVLGEVVTDMQPIHRIASTPSDEHVFRLADPSDPFETASFLVDRLCLQIDRVCPISTRCERPVSLALHGRGFAQVDPESQLLCQARPTPQSIAVGPLAASPPSPPKPHPRSRERLSHCQPTSQ